MNNKKALFLYHVSFSIVGVKEGSILSKVDSINQECPMEIALNLLSGKWRLKILYYLLKGESIHFNQLQRLLGDITTKVLTAQLRTLEEAGIVSVIEYLTLIGDSSYTTLDTIPASSSVRN